MIEQNTDAQHTCPAQVSTSNHECSIVEHMTTLQRVLPHSIRLGVARNTHLPMTGCDVAFTYWSVVKWRMPQYSETLMIPHFSGAGTVPRHFVGMASLKTTILRRRNTTLSKDSFGHHRHILRGRGCTGEANSRTILMSRKYTFSMDIYN